MKEKKTTVDNSSTLLFLNTIISIEKGTVCIACIMWPLNFRWKLKKKSRSPTQYFLRWKVVRYEEKWEK